MTQRAHRTRPDGRPGAGRELVATTEHRRDPSNHPRPDAVCWRAGSAAAALRLLRRSHPGGAVDRELPGDDHVLISTDWRRALAAIEDVHRGPGRCRCPSPTACSRRSCSATSSAQLNGRRRSAIAPGALSSTATTPSVRRELARHRGREIDTAGDGFFATFDGPARAIRCAVAMREASGRPRPRRSDRPARWRVRARRQRSARRSLSTSARGSAHRRGQARSSSRARCATSSRAPASTFEDAGRRHLKGVPEPWQTYRVSSERRARIPTDIVGDSALTNGTSQASLTSPLAHRSERTAPIAGDSLGSRILSTGLLTGLREASRRRSS